MGVKKRASLALTAQTTLDPAKVHSMVKEAAGQVKGGGTSLLTTGWVNIGAQVNIEREATGSIDLSITSGKRLLELCTFPAKISRDGGLTQLRVGGLETYKHHQQSIFFIPVTPKMIEGMAPYKQFLANLGALLQAGDPAAQVTIAESA